MSFGLFYGVVCMLCYWGITLYTFIYFPKFSVFRLTFGVLVVCALKWVAENMLFLAQVEVPLRKK